METERILKTLALITLIFFVCSNKNISCRLLRSNLSYQFKDETSFLQKGTYCLLVYDTDLLCFVSIGVFRVNSKKPIISVPLNNSGPFHLQVTKQCPAGKSFTIRQVWFSPKRSNMGKNLCVPPWKLTAGCKSSCDTTAITPTTSHGTAAVNHTVNHGERGGSPPDRAVKPEDLPTSTIGAIIGGICLTIVAVVIIVAVVMHTRLRRSRGQKLPIEEVGLGEEQLQRSNDSCHQAMANCQSDEEEGEP